MAFQPGERNPAHYLSIISPTNISSKEKLILENKNNTETKVLDFEKLIRFIEEKSGLDSDTIGTVLDLETKYMIQVGIIDLENQPEYHPDISGQVDQYIKCVESSTER